MSPVAVEGALALEAVLGDGAKVYAAAFCEGLRPDPLVTVTQWADENRFLSSKSSAEPGRWNTARTPYLRQIMDDLSPSSPVEDVVFMKGAQVGGTECGQNWIGFVIDRAPGPMMMVQPTVDIAKRVSRQRLDPLLRESPALCGRVREQRERDSGNTLLMKEFEGGVLMLAGANSAAGLRSMPIRFLFLDEVDAYPGDVEGEGDPVDLAEKRTSNFARRKKFKVSTPTVEGRSRIDAALQESDRRHYHVPCPDCGHKQVIRWPSMRWDEGKPETVRLVCACCGFEIREHHKTAMLAAGEWVPENPGHRVHGYHLSALYSPLGWFSWADAVRQFEAANGKPDRLRVFVNTVLGETWREQGEAPEWEKLYRRREAYRRNTVPAGGLLLTAGVDVQKDRLEIEIVAWGKAHESWSIDYRVIPGDTSGDAVWEVLTKLLDETWEAAPAPGAERGVPLKLRMMAVDSGFNTQRVYTWARQHAGDRVIVVKGRDTQDFLVGQPRAADVNQAGRKIARGIKVWPVGVDLVKNEVYGRLRLEEPLDGKELPFGWCHFPEYGEEYFKMLTAEQKVVRIVHGYRRPRWEKIRERNEALDCRVYARAAAAVAGIDRWTDEHWSELAAIVTAAPAREVEKPVTTGAGFIPRVGKGWLERHR